MESLLTQSLTAVEHDRLRRCPTCNHKLTLKQAIVLLHDSGVEEYVFVKSPDGTEAFVEVGRVNPRAVDILEV
jgi:hypothetical protein